MPESIRIVGTVPASDHDPEPLGPSEHVLGPIPQSDIGTSTRCGSTGYLRKRRLGRLQHRSSSPEALDEAPHRDRSNPRQLVEGV